MEIKQEIQDNFLDLLHQLEVTPIIDHLFQARVINFQTFDGICGMPDNRKRREILLAVMRTDIHDQETFLDILKTHQPRLYNNICNKHEDTQVHGVRRREKDENKTGDKTRVKVQKNAWDSVEQEDGGERVIYNRHEVFPQHASQQNIQQDQSGTRGHAVRWTMDEAQWQASRPEGLNQDPSYQLSRSVSLMAMPVRPTQEFHVPKQLRPKTSVSRSFLVPETAGIDDRISSSSIQDQGNNSVRQTAQTLNMHTIEDAIKRRRSVVFRQLTKSRPEVYYCNGNSPVSRDDEDLNESNENLRTRQEELMRQNKTFCDELIEQDTELDKLRSANTMLLVKNNELSSQLSQLKNTDKQPMRREKSSYAGEMPGQATFDLDCAGLVQGLVVCPSLIFDDEKANKTYCHLHGITQMVSKPESPNTFSKFYGTCTTYPLSVVAPQYWESEIEISPVAKVKDECLFVDISITWERERDLNYNNASTTHSWRLCVVFCPLHQRICVWLWHKKHLKCYAVAKAVPHAPSYSLNYGFLFHAEKKRLTILDLKDRIPTVVHEMNQINVNDNLWPMYGIYNEKWAKSTVRLLSGDRIDMTSDKKKMINIVLEKT